MEKKTIIAFMYDFDKTLSPKDMQEYTFIPSLNMEPEEFWQKADTLSEEENMDRILSYMYNMVTFAKQNDIKLTKEAFNKLGKDVKLFKGVAGWFKRINDYGKSKGVTIEHYILSSGIKEIIEGTSIAKYFKKIYACEFLYDKKTKVAKWPKQAVNYTTKTQFLFRISKGVLDIYEDNTLNTKMKDEQRRIPYRNMIYFGDGLTDVPCMKLVKAYGGYSIAIYQKNLSKVKKLIEDGRVQFVCKSDYTENSELDIIVKRIVDQMVTTNAVEAIRYEQETSRKNIQF